MAGIISFALFENQIVKLPWELFRLMENGKQTALIIQLHLLPYAPFKAHIHRTLFSVRSSTHVAHSTHSDSDLKFHMDCLPIYLYVFKLQNWSKYDKYQCLPPRMSGKQYRPRTAAAAVGRLSRVVVVTHFVAEFFCINS